MTHGVLDPVYLNDRLHCLPGRVSCQTCAVKGHRAGVLKVEAVGHIIIGGHGVVALGDDEATRQIGLGVIGTLEAFHRHGRCGSGQRHQCGQAVLLLAVVVQPLARNGYEMDTDRLFGQLRDI